MTRGVRHVRTKGWTVLGVTEDETTKQSGLMIWKCRTKPSMGFMRMIVELSRDSRTASPHDAVGQITRHANQNAERVLRTHCAIRKWLWKVPKW